MGASQKAPGQAVAVAGAGAGAEAGAGAGAGAGAEAGAGAGAERFRYSFEELSPQEGGRQIRDAPVPVIIKGANISLHLPLPISPWPHTSGHRDWVLAIKTKIETFKIPVSIYQHSTSWQNLFSFPKKCAMFVLHQFVTNCDMIQAIFLDVWICLKNIS